MVDEPVWDGTGEDPYIPEDVPEEVSSWWVLAAAAEVAVLAAYLEIQSSFLEAIADLFTESLDATVVFSRSQQWQQDVDDFVDTTLRDTYTQGYTFTYPERDEPTDTALAQAQNRALTRRNQLVQFPDEVYLELQQRIATAINDGDNPRQIVDDIDAFLLDADTPYWENRAIAVARTETLGALNGGRYDAQNDIDTDTPGITWVREWVSTRDTSTRPTHVVANEQTVPIGTTFIVGGAPLRFPGDPQGPPDEIIQCRCTTIMREVDTP